MTVEIYSIIISLFFGVLSIIFFFKTKRIKYPVFVYIHSQLQLKKHPDLTLYFKGQKIDNLQRIFVLFYNKGKKAIRKNDIPLNSRPMIKFNDWIKILSFKVIKVSDDLIEFKVNKIEETTLEIDFNFLNKDDGGIIEILYEGDTSNIKKNIPTFVSKIIDTNKIKSINYSQKGDPIFYYFWFPLIISLFLFGIFGIYQIYFSKVFNSYLDQYFSFFVILLLTSIILISGSIFEKRYRRVPKFAREIFEKM